MAVRCRPFNAREKQLASPCIISMSGPETVITNPVTGATKNFTFDYSYWSHDLRGASYASQQTVFDDLGRDVLENAWAGYNVCLFAYGQTGSGKSYSMVGYGDEEGIVPRACREIFARMHAANKGGRAAGPIDGGAQVEVTMIEIYNERVKDLLSPSAATAKGSGSGSGGGSGGGSGSGGGGLKVRTHPVNGPYVDGLKPCAVRDYDEVRAGAS